jgi:hypothetical protein
MSSLQSCSQPLSSIERLNRQLVGIIKTLLSAGSLLLERGSWRLLLLVKLYIRFTSELVKVHLVITLLLLVRSELLGPLFIIMVLRISLPSIFDVVLYDFKSFLPVVIWTEFLLGWLNTVREELSW